MSHENLEFSHQVAPREANRLGRPFITDRGLGDARLNQHFKRQNYNGAGPSVLIAMVAHLFLNVLTATMKPLFSSADQERYWLIMVGVECLTALAVLIATRGRVGLELTNQRLRDG